MRLTALLFCQQNPSCPPLSICPKGDAVGKAIFNLEILYFYFNILRMFLRAATGACFFLKILGSADLRNLLALTRRNFSDPC